MSDIEKLRSEMEKITADMLKLLKTRTDIARKIGNLKNEQGLTVTDESREDELKNKISKYGFNLCSKKTFKEAITSLKLNKNDIIIITGSLYLAGEVLNLN